MCSIIQQLCSCVYSALCLTRLVAANINCVQKINKMFKENLLGSLQVAQLCSDVPKALNFFSPETIFSGFSLNMQRSRCLLQCCSSVGSSLSFLSCRCSEFIKAEIDPQIVQFLAWHKISLHFNHESNLCTFLFNLCMRL